MRDARNSFKEVERILRRDSGLITANPRPIRLRHRETLKRFFIAFQADLYFYSISLRSK